MEVKAGEIWQDFIRNGLHPGQLSKEVPDSDFIGNFLQQSRRLRQEFIDCLLLEVTVIKEEAHLKVLVYGYQTLLCYYINTLFEYLATYPTDNGWQQLYESVVKDLEHDLTFIQRYFKTYFDAQTPVPISMREECKQAIVQLDDQLTANRQLNIFYGELHPLLVDTLNHYTDGHVSFVRYSYLILLVDNFLSFKAPYRFPALFDSHLMQFCVAQNINAPAIITYIVSFIAERLADQNTMEEKKEWVGGQLKQLYQLSADGQGGLLAEQPSVSDTLVNWLEQENLYIAVQKRETKEAPEQSPKLNTSVSVPVLALFTRIFKESGIITNSNLQEIFRFVSSNYTSQRQETISPGNFHGKYYTVEESTKRKVTDLLLEMVKAVKRIQ